MTSRIVVVEDEVELLQMIQYALENEGYDVTPVEHPQLLPENWAYQPDLFLIDMMLPGTDGIALADRLRARGASTTPMIATSASTAELKSALHAGVFDRVLVKPFDLDELFSSVHACLEGSEPE